MSKTSPPSELKPISAGDRLEIYYLDNSDLVDRADSGRDIIDGLTGQPKTLPARYFYDDKGSELFEQICQLPEYYPTRTEASILEQYASEIPQLTGMCELIELGSGSSTKTRRLLDAYAQKEYPLHYVPIDVSAGILEASAQQLLAIYPSLKVRGRVGTYQQALAQLTPTVLPRRMVFFLGSSLGNFAADESDRFLKEIRSVLQFGDYFLLGIDLHKSKEVLEAAYNDRQGVTAQFNLNLLAHLNWRFDGNFNLDLFEHQAIYNQTQRQIEMYLHCREYHQVRLEKLDLTVEFEPGEGIRTEISRKFDLDKMQQDLRQIGLNPVQTWSDAKQWFGLVLCRVESL
ncbi:MAG: L-histidine N(alpha)-methyltransferase [Cyanobacteriota bacterium]|nr:L-histidine N(alpha)-methyltransferase [Cyanobacteriota bacterium]